MFVKVYKSKIYSIIHTFQIGQKTYFESRLIFYGFIFIVIYLRTNHGVFNK